MTYTLTNKEAPGNRVVFSKNQIENVYGPETHELEEPVYVYIIQMLQCSWSHVGCT